MMKYRLIYLIWLLPLVLLGLTIHQSLVYNGLETTYEEGESYLADVVDFEIKQIAAQTNGYVILRFQPNQGEVVQRKLSLPVNLASQLMDSEQIPIRYHPDSFQSVVMINTYQMHRQMAFINGIITIISALVTAVTAFFAHRFASRKLSDGEEELVLNRTDIPTEA